MDSYPLTPLSLQHSTHKHSADHHPLLSPTVPSHQSSASQHASTDGTPQVHAASMRRKKNADAQAAFRARRANYIASLEETGTRLSQFVRSISFSIFPAFPAIF